MKQIFTVIKAGKLTVKNGKREICKIKQHCYEWHYAELRPDSTELITSYDEFIKLNCYVLYPSTTKRDKRIFGEQYANFFTEWREIKFSNVNFVSYEIKTAYREIKNYTMQTLINNLPADEMIEYLKDNGLNVCPIVR